VCNYTKPCLNEAINVWTGVMLRYRPIELFLNDLDDFRTFYNNAVERETATVRPDNIRRLVAAEIQFQMLSGSPGQPISLSADCNNSASSFVQYNFARICQILRTFEKVSQKIFYSAKSILAEGEARSLL
jgi:arginyl-tRNA synthetase